MKSFIAFTKKEFVEQLRSFKFFILVIIFFLLGMMSPVLAKLLPDILSSVDMQGIEFTIKEVTDIDAYTQLFSNINQMGIIILVLIFSGTLSQELTKGTLINILSKGLDRGIVIVSKYLASLVAWTISYGICVLTSYLYTIFLFEDNTGKNIFFSFFMLWLFGAFVLAVLIFSSTVINGNYGGLLLTAIILGLLLLINIIPNSYEYSPMAMSTKNIYVILGQIQIKDLLMPTIITGLLTVILVFSTVVMFKKKKM